MSPHENTAIAELIGEVRGMRGEVEGMRSDLRVMHTKLFGDPETENEKGRFPKLEAKVEELSGRVEPLEENLQQKSFLKHCLSAAGGAIVTLASFIYYLHNITRH